MGEILVSSGYGFNTRKPFIEMQDDDKGISVQLAPEEARQLASSLVFAAEAAEQDAFLVEYAEKVIGAKDDAAVAALLSEFRDWRNKDGHR